MAVKSIEHTIFIHDQGVGLAIQDYRIQAQARMNLGANIKAAKGIRGAILSHGFHQFKLMRYENDPYQYIYFLDVQIYLLQYSF